MSYNITINVMDTETTGFQAPPSGNIVEIAVTPLIVTFADSSENKILNMQFGKMTQELANPGMRIPTSAMCIHHIREDMVKDARPAEEVLEDFAKMPCDYWAAHNADFDSRFFKPNDGRWICTLKAARIIYPEMSKHTNQYLRYKLGLDKLIKDDQRGDTHRAGFDTLITGLLLNQMLLKDVMTLEDMANLQSNPNNKSSGLGTIPFGKHKGKEWEKIPKDYLRWLMGSSGDDKIVAACRSALGIK